MSAKVGFRLLLIALVALLSTVALADDPVTGVPPLGSIASGPFDSVDLANLDVHFSIPIFSRPGVGKPFTYNLSYDSLVWVPSDLQGTATWAPVANWGWRAQSDATLGYVTNNYSFKTYKCGSNNEDVYKWWNFVYHDASGTAHPFPLSSYIQQVDDPGEGGCHKSNSFTTSTAMDNSGYILKPETPYQGISSVDTTVLASGGLTFVPPPSNNTNGNGSVTDPNGNAVNVVLNGSTTTITDTLGTPPALTIIGTPPSPPCSGTVQYQYAAPGALATVIVYYGSYTVQTNFNVAINGVRISEFPATNECLVNKVKLPDGTFYFFTYESTAGVSGNTTGRIASITLPTGWTINYSYTGFDCYNNNNCMMADGSPSSMQRTYAQYGGTWKYARGIQAGQQLPQTTTQIIDPDRDETDLKFSGIYETERKVYHENDLLNYSYRCYNTWTSDAACPGATVTPPIKWSTIDDRLNTISTDPNGYYGWHAWSYDNGNITQAGDYDYGSNGYHIRLNQTNNTYLPCTQQNICNELHTSQILDGDGASKSYTIYGYDEDGHGEHGKVTSIKRYGSGSPSGAYLQQSYSYNANGTLKTATDPKGTITDYYSGNYSCNGAFPNQVTVAGLTTRYAYDCRGGVVVNVTDPNGAGTQTIYNDPYYWRPAKSTDALANVTYYNYYGADNSGDSAISLWSQVESVMKWNGGNSITDKLTQWDGYGRIYLEQTRTAPRCQGSCWDTINYFYDSSGRLQFLARPVVAGAAQHSGGGIPSTGYYYDALGRITAKAECDRVSCSAGDGEKWSYIYNANDVKVTQSSNNGSGQTFGKQLEYDALGRLTSVCELSNSLSGVGGCGQNTNPGNGYRTVYSYDANGNLSTVQQNVQGQTVQNRSFTYDGLGRMLSETNPENGTTQYVYDSVNDGHCNGNFPGDKVERVDAATNVTCYTWDGLHRLTSVNYVSGPNAANSMNKEYQYDTSNPDGYDILVGYPKGRLVESHTSNSSGWAVTEMFGYDALGEPTDAWYWIPDGQGWYHTQSGYAPSGAIWARGGFLGTGTDKRFTNGLGYTVDGEGRLNGLWDQSLHQSVWSGTTYNPAGQPDRVAFSSGDYETFSWDQTSGRMTQWKSVVGSKTQTGNLNWNANGTLYQLAITDTADTPNSQTCTNSYDDLARLSQNYCGGAWSQTFTYDAFGNIKKTGPSSNFAPSYASNNRISGSGFNYDGMGNVTKEGSNTYSYDAEGRPVKVNGDTVFTDGFNRVVEVQGQSYHEFVYAPDGWKLARMNGQAVEQVSAPLAAGMQVVYGPYSTQNNAAPVLLWRHSDWLGSERLASTPNRTVYFDGAYAPYAENYAGIGTSDRSFTGKTIDTDTFGLYDFPMRDYSQAQGRWNAPDPAGLSAVDPTDPQTWNRYAYVGNRPLNSTDPQGTAACDDDAKADDGCGGVRGGDLGLDGGDCYDSGCIIASGGDSSNGPSTDYCGDECYTFSTTVHCSNCLGGGNSFLDDGNLGAADLFGKVGAPYWNNGAGAADTALVATGAIVTGGLSLELGTLGGGAETLIQAMAGGNDVGYALWTGEEGLNSALAMNELSNGAVPVLYDSSVTNSETIIQNSLNFVRSQTGNGVAFVGRGTGNILLNYELPAASAGGSNVFLVPIP